MSEVLTGVVKKWIVDRGFGFIATDAGEDIFVHFREIKGSEALFEGDRVAFTIIKGPDGRPRAGGVEVLG